MTYLGWEWGCTDTVYFLLFFLKKGVQVRQGQAGVEDMVVQGVEEVMAVAGEPVARAA